VIFDPRITPIRNDLSSKIYEGQVKRKKFSKGTIHTVIAPNSPLYNKKNSKLSTQLLYGETCKVFEVSKEWSWVQSLRDDYVGYAPSTHLKKIQFKPTHKVKSLRTFIYSKPNIKSKIISHISFNSIVQITKHENNFCKIKNLGWCPKKDLSLINESKFNIVELAKIFLNTPYYWGGKDSLGIDCSGLIQNIMQMKNIDFPRDTDMQEDFCAQEVKKTNLKPGDLVFWRGHVALMIDNKRIIHANAFHMKTCVEPLLVAEKRIYKTNGKVRKYGRIIFK
tara:strand:- start:2915 stop:3751 length:837 start_codon:yes stop_codon:yes gene_type:complete